MTSLNCEKCTADMTYFGTVLSERNTKRNKHASLTKDAQQDLTGGVTLYINSASCRMAPSVCKVRCYVL